MTGTDKVQGQCPMGCGTTLFLGEAGHVTCSWHACPDPTMADTILTDPRGADHVVAFGEVGFSITHPLRERHQNMEECSLHTYCRSLAGAPVKPGRYRAVEQEDPVAPWRFETLP